MQTTQDIIKLLPLGEEFKQDLLKNYDSYEEDKKFMIERIVWNTYDAIYQSFIDKNVEVQFLQVDEGRDVMNKDFYKNAVKEADLEFKEYLSKKSASDELKGVRDKLESLIKPS